MGFIERYSTILLDVCDTFMFGVDNFSSNERFDKTYKRIGGKKISPEIINKAITDWYEFIIKDYNNPQFFNNFPTANYYIKKVIDKYQLPFSEELNLEKVIASHEAGIIPLEFINTLKYLNLTHKLGIVSNIWSKSQYFIDILKEFKIFNFFDVIVFSSDYGKVKPSTDIFEIALRELKVSKEESVYIGNSLTHDINGGTAAGLDTIWVSYGKIIPSDFKLKPTYIIEDLTKLHSC